MMSTSSDLVLVGPRFLGKIALHFEKRWVCRRCTATFLGHKRCLVEAFN
jgi:hypothetical protein